MFMAISTLANIAVLASRESVCKIERKGAFCRFLVPYIGRSGVEMTHFDCRFDTGPATAIVASPGGRVSCGPNAALKENACTTRHNPKDY